MIKAEDVSGNAIGDRWRVPHNALRSLTTIAPQPGPQTDFLRSSADICIYGGAAGGGKTVGLILERRSGAVSQRQVGASCTRTGEPRRRSPFRPYLAMNDFAGLTPALLAGRGIGELPPVVQPELLRTGRLVEVMPGWRFLPFDLSLVHLGNRHLSKPCRLFKEFATQMAQALFPDLPG